MSNLRRSMTLTSSQMRRSGTATSSFLQGHVIDGNQRTEYSLGLFFTVMVMLASGTLMMMGYKVQSADYGYSHGLMQTSQMFLGEWLNLIIFFFINVSHKTLLMETFSEMKDSARTNKTKLRFSKLWMALTSFMDSVSSGMSISSLLLLPTSITMMLGGINVVASAVVSLMFFGRKIHRHHFLGCLMTLSGFVLVGMSSIINSKKTGDSKNGGEAILGMILVASGSMISAFQKNLQEYIFRNYELPVQREVGTEGLFGIVWIFLWLSVLSFIPCPSKSICKIGGTMDDVLSGTMDMLASPGLIFWTLMSIFGMAIYGWTNIMLVKKISCMFGAFMGTMPTITVWFASIIFGYEKFDTRTSGFQLFGFVFLILGNFTYNEIIEIPFCGLNKKMSKYLAAEEEEGKLREGV